MFTGLVEALGTVRLIAPRETQARMTIALPFARDLSLGESVAINGCCLTVAAHDSETADFDLLGQTLRITSLGALQAGSIVNLERAMVAGARFGGHFVQGHVDGTGEVVALEPHGQDHRLEISLPPEIHSLCIDKGSITIDGISLTIAELGDTTATFWITPHTFNQTHLHRARVGQPVNLEADVLAKYVDKLLAARRVKS